MQVDGLSRRDSRTGPFVAARSSGRKDWTNEAAAGGILLLLLLLGALAMLPVTVQLVRLWRDDPLRSFGALLPAAFVVLTARAWRSIGYTRSGTAWGLLPVAGAIAGARLFGTLLLAYRWNGIEIAPLQPGLLCFLYGSGVLLLLGGIPLWRAAWLPVCLLLCVDPVPHLFERLDYPLQTISAATARGFAGLLGLHPSGEQLQMMFAPRFGMVIVPGCNGVRGSATMVYLALLIGYVRAMRAYRTALLMLAALCLGYALNLLRLCLLVVYYWAGTHVPAWQAHGEGIDYCIGGALFLLVTMPGGYLLFRPGLRTVPAHHGAMRGRVVWTPAFLMPRWLLGGALLLLAATTEVPGAFALAGEADDYVAPDLALQMLPSQAGPWHREKFWTEIYYQHPVWLWTTYRRADGAAVDMGVWLSPKRHFAIQSRMMNGSKPLLGQGFAGTAESGLPMRFSVWTLLDDLDNAPRPVPTLFAETVCLPTGCGMQQAGFRERGWIVAMSPLSVGAQRRLPLLYRVQSAAGSADGAANRGAGEQQIRDLSARTDVAALVQAIGTREPSMQ